MELVVDANIFIAGFLRSAVTRELLLADRLSLWTPEYGISEVERVLIRPGFRRRLGNLAIPEIRTILAHLSANVQVVPTSDYHAWMRHAKLLAPHPEDAPYLALALHLNIPLWSNDLAIKRQQKVRVYTTQELLLALA